MADLLSLLEEPKVIDPLAVLLEHKPSRWRSFTNDVEILRCCGQDFGNYAKKPRRTDKSAYELWAAHVAEALADVEIGSHDA